MNCRLICIDIDGTLLNDTQEILPAVKDAVKRQYRKGRKIALVSGRMPCGVSLIEKQLGIDCIKICNAGTSIIIDGQCVKEEGMPTSVARKLYTEIAEKYDVGLWAFHGLEWYVNRLDDFVKNEITVIEHAPTVIQMDDLLELWDKNRMCPNKLLIAAEEKKLNEIQTELDMWNTRAFDVAKSSVNYLEIFPKNVDKGRAVLALCKILHINASDVVAIGDQELDIPMIEAVGFGIAMGNAIPALKEKADVVTLTNNEAGVAYALNQYV